jgi:hypothetical protein
LSVAVFLAQGDLPRAIRVPYGRLSTGPGEPKMDIWAIIEYRNPDRSVTLSETEFAPVDSAVILNGYAMLIEKVYHTILAQ